ncbi:hypothetical protein GCM10023080_026250 [Streptomyces pseudoechinosporeus]
MGITAGSPTAVPIEESGHARSEFRAPLPCGVRHNRRGFQADLHRDGPEPPLPYPGTEQEDGNAGTDRDGKLGRWRP